LLRRRAAVNNRLRRAICGFVFCGILGVQCWRFATIEPPPSVDPRLQTRADVAAQSGVQYALAELRRRLRTELAPRFEPLSRVTDRMQFSVGLRECASQINVNMRSAKLRRLLNLLGEEIDWHYRQPGTAERRRHAGFRTRPLGDWLLLERDQLPGRRFRREAQIRALLGRRYSREVADEEFEKLRHFITLYGWRNTKVLEPGTLMTAQQAGSLREARSPINLNSASLPVLTAWVRGIAYTRWVRGVYQGEVSLDRKFGAARLRELMRRLRAVARQAPLRSQLELADILHGRKPLADTQPHADYRPLQEALDAAEFDRWDRDALLAMADPNSRLNKFNPDRTHYRKVDKYDLVGWTTELTFYSLGRFEISSVGQALRDGEVVARSSRTAVYQLTDQLYLTTQEDFERDRLRTAERTAEDSQSGQRLLLERDGFWGVISYPEPPGLVARYDGALSLNALTRAASPAGEFLAGFNYPLGAHPTAPGKSALDAFKPADASSNNRGSARSVQGGERLPLTDRRIPASRSLSAADAQQRFSGGSDAFPLGVYIDGVRRRGLRYDVSAAGRHGSIQFWVKPRYHDSRYPEVWVSWSSGDARVQLHREGTDVVGLFRFGTDSQERRISYDASHWQAGEWHHVHLDWGDTGRIFIDGEEADQGGADGCKRATHPRARHAHLDGSAGPGKAQLWLGQSSYGANHANATFDNLRLSPWRIHPRRARNVRQTIPERYAPLADRRRAGIYWQDITRHFARYPGDIRLRLITANSSGRIGLYLKVGQDSPELVAGAGTG